MGLFDYRIRIRIHSESRILGSDSLGKSNDLGVSNESDSLLVRSHCES